MPNSELRTEYPYEDESPAASEHGSDRDELKSILDAIVAQLSDADRRHSATLTEMQDRIAGMEHETEMLRHQVPEQFAPAFSRIETGVAELAQRLADVSNVRIAAAEMEPAASSKIPMPLRSALLAEDGEEHARHEESSRRTDGVDTFDVIGSSLPGDAADPWDHESAEALTNVYDSDAARSKANAASQSAEPQGRERVARAANGAAVDQAWLEGRFAEIARAIEQSLADIRPDHGFFAMAQRLDQIEQHFTELFKGVATQADIAAVRLVEAHVEEVVNHFVQTHDQLARLNVIEEQLTTISHSLAEVQDGAQGRAFYDGAAADELRPLIERLMSDNRRGEENTAALLETLQQAMIRLLDRVESVEWTQQHRPVDREFAPHAHEFDERPSDLESKRAFGVIEGDATVALDAAVAAVASAQPAQALRPEMVDDGGRHDVAHHDFVQRKSERLRQDFIAEAQRAKMRLAAEDDDRIIIEAPAARTPADSATVTKTAEIRGSRPIRPPVAPAKRSGPSGPSPRLMVLAVVALAALTGLWYSLGSGDRAVPQHPAALASPTNSVKSSDAAKTAPAQPGSPAEDNARRGDATPPNASEGRVIPSIAPAPTTTLPMLGVAVDTGRPVTQSDLQLAKRHQAMAKMSGEIGDAAAKASNQAVLPASMEPSEAETSGTSTAPEAKVSQGGVSRATSLDMPAATVGPLSLRLAAAHGDPSAEFEVGARFAEGKGMTQNLQEAAKWYQLSADQGFAQAQYRLGTLYERGLGVKADRPRAAAWYQRAAEQGNIKAMHNLAVLSANQSGESPDYVTAAHWFEEAAKRGLADSQFNLAVLYENGLGVKRDVQRAFMWLSLAARDGDKDAVRRRDILRGKLTASEMTAADQMIANWRPVATDRAINDARTAGEAWKDNPKNGISG
jgi:localization factor PodJL